MLYLVLIGILTAVLLLTLFLTTRTPARSAKIASMTAKQAILERILMAPPPRYRVIIRPQLAAPKPAPVEGFVRGNHAKPVNSPAPFERRPASPPSEPPKPTPVTPVSDRVLAAAQARPVPAPAPHKPVDTNPARQLQQSPIQLSTPRMPQASAELGRQLLGADGKREGNVPLISMDYCATLGWAGYVTGMQKLGGEFFLYNPTQQRIMARADVRNNEFTPVADNELRGLSPRVRQIEDEPAIAPLLAKGRKQFNIPEPELILLLPLQADFEIVGGLARALANRPDTNKPVARVSGVYERADSGVQLHVAQLFYPDGNSQPCDLVLPLRKPVQASTAK